LADEQQVNSKLKLDLS